MTHRRLLLALAALSPALVALPLALGAPVDVLLAAPLVVLLAPLLVGRYVGEQRLVAFAHRARPRRRRTPPVHVPRPAAAGDRIHKGWLLWAERAVRPPPRRIVAMYP